MKKILICFSILFSFIPFLFIKGHCKTVVPPDNLCNINGSYSLTSTYTTFDTVDVIHGATYHINGLFMAQTNISAYVNVNIVGVDTGTIYAVLARTNFIEGLSFTINNDEQVYIQMRSAPSSYTMYVQLMFSLGNSKSDFIPYDTTYTSPSVNPLIFGSNISTVIHYNDGRVITSNKFDILEYGVSLSDEVENFILGQIDLGYDIRYVEFIIDNLSLDTNIYNTFIGSFDDSLDFTFYYTDDTTDYFNYYDNISSFNRRFLSTNKVLSKIVLNSSREFNLIYIEIDSFDKKIYDYGYDDGLKDGYDDGFSKGQSYGHAVGIEEGISQGLQQSDFTQSGLKNLFASIINFPINFLKTVFDFEFFGINLSALFSFLISIGIVVFVVKRFRS